MSLVKEGRGGTDTGACRCRDGSSILLSTLVDVQRAVWVRYVPPGKTSQFFCKIKGMLPFVSEEYEPGSFPYVDDGSQPVDRAAWMGIFYESIGYFRDIAALDRSVVDAQRKADSFAEAYRRSLDALENSPLDASVKYTCLHLCKLREHALREAGFTDVFRDVKANENVRALRLLRGVCAELDALPEVDAWPVVIENILAGNIFDCGTAATRGGSFCFRNSRLELRPRPWAVDDLDLFVETMASKQKYRKYRKVLLFCDNSGPDFCLGVLPFARQLLKTGRSASVVIAANTLPALNDMTYDDIISLLPEVFREDGLLEELVESKRLRFVPSGSDLPVIDLSGRQNELSAELIEEAQDADFVVLEGMGRSIETNLFAELRGVDKLCVGMIKHQVRIRCQA